MEKYLSHYSAAYHWAIPYLDNVLDSKYVNRYHVDQIVDITVNDRNKEYKKKKHNIHVCKLPLPQSTIIKHGNVFVASPELVFLELANQMDMNRLILLGLQMCSHPPGEPSKALTTKRKLTIFLEKTQRHFGHRKAVRALRYVQNGSASIMESIAFMILTLPNSYGGFALCGAVFNHEINLETKDKRYRRQKKCFVDLFYKNARLAVEYDSFTHHSRPSEQSRDLLRATSLENLGIEVVRFSTVQLYDKDACKEFAQNLATHLGKKIIIRTKKFYSAHKSLRDLLPLKNR